MASIERLLWFHDSMMGESDMPATAASGTKSMDPVRAKAPAIVRKRKRRIVLSHSGSCCLRPLWLGMLTVTLQRAGAALPSVVSETGGCNAVRTV